MASNEKDNILVKNIYYMLSYAFKALRQDKFEKVGAESFDNAENLFAAILSNGIGQQLKQGLYREYIGREDDLPVLRGKLNMSGTIQNEIAHRRRLSCQYDELSENSLLNRIGQRLVEVTVFVRLHFKFKCFVILFRHFLYLLPQSL